MSERELKDNNTSSSDQRDEMMIPYQKKVCIMHRILQVGRMPVENENLAVGPVETSAKEEEVKKD